MEDYPVRGLIAPPTADKQAAAHARQRAIMLGRRATTPRAGN